jgi:hypothetical protein
MPQGKKASKARKAAAAAAAQRTEAQVAKEEAPQRSGAFANCDRVQLHSLASEAGLKLNGELGVIGGWDDQSGRFIVLLDSPAQGALGLALRASCRSDRMTCMACTAVWRTASWNTSSATASNAAAERRP